MSRKNNSNHVKYIEIRLSSFLPVCGRKDNGTNHDIRNPGLVADEQSEPVVGATVLATHIPSGTRYGGVTDADGRYYVRGMRTGGPYRIVISFVGMQTSETDGVNLKLGEVFRHDVKWSKLPNCFQ